MAAATAISRATFPIFDPIFYIKFILKNGEIWRGGGGGIPDLAQAQPWRF